jgi:hypothetical protein
MTFLLAPKVLRAATIKRYPAGLPSTPLQTANRRRVKSRIRLRGIEIANVPPYRQRMTKFGGQATRIIPMENASTMPFSTIHRAQKFFALFDKAVQDRL